MKKKYFDVYYISILILQTKLFFIGMALRVNLLKIQKAKSKQILK